ncbi:hypothetical protein F5X97DRAFT_309619 [Nemania serpens]|nr:hypothetical protein F5X97DRAFT_309619 [Nemania serpens]
MIANQKVYWQPRDAMITVVFPELYIVEAMATLVTMDNLMQQMAMHEARRDLLPLQKTIAPTRDGAPKELG